MADGKNTAAVLGVLKGAAPILGTALAAGNPLGALVAGAAVDFLAARLGVQDKTPEAVTQALSQLPTPELAKLDYEFKQHLEDNNFQLNLAQIDTNKTEAGSQFLFVAGWRPYIGWICGTGIGYQFLLRPFLNGMCALFGYDDPLGPFPTLEIQDLIAIVVTMLGHSYLRSKDKARGVANE